jgi:putative transcriptional regulator
MIRSQLKVILAQRQVEGRPPYTVAELAAVTGLNRQSLYGLCNNTTTRFDSHVLNALCRVLEVDVGRLLMYVPDEL